MSVDYRSMYDKQFLGAWDVQDRDVTVTITKVEAGNLTGQGGRTTKKPVIRMAKTEKGFALNATNGRTIATLYGNLVDKWIGKRIILYKSTTRNPNGDGDVDCIRVRPAIPKANGAARPQREEEHDNGFSDEPPASGTDHGLAEAITRIASFDNEDKMADYVSALPDVIRTDDALVVVFRAKVDELRLR